VTFRPVVDLPVEGEIYAEGWQTWSPVTLHRAGETSERASDERAQLVEWRPDKPVPEGVIQAEGVLAIESADGQARAWFAPDPASEVATMRLALIGKRLVLVADGPVEEMREAGLEGVLAAVGKRLGPGALKPSPTGWCSWSHYFKHVTETDVVENLEAAIRLELPIDVFQLDDGYEQEVGDWLDIRPEFGSLERLADRIGSAGKRAGIWIAPFMVSPESELAARHPGWLVPGVDAGTHWSSRMRILDVTQPAAAEYIANVFRAFAEWGYSYYKLDFLYAAAIPGLDRYRAAMLLVRDAIGPDATVLMCGAPLLPSIGLCDAMRVGPDVLPEVADPQLDVERVVRITSLRGWMNGRLWVNDPDCLVARAEIKERDAWAAHLMRYGGLRFSSDRLSTLDRHGVELTRRFLGAGT
jgi:alpha-galactosidase